MMNRFPSVTCFIAVCALAVGASSSIEEALEFSREAISRGEIWRLFTAHLTHFSGEHLMWDVFALVALGSIAEIKSRCDWLVALIVAAPLITLAVWLVQPHFEVYRGLSGIDCAAYGVVVGHLLRDGWRERHRLTFALGVCACVAALAKCGYELATGEAFFVGAATDSFSPAPLAHFVGVVVGVAVVASLRCDGVIRSRPDRLCALVRRVR